MNTRSYRILNVALAVVVLSATSALAEDLWLHVRVDEADGAKVSVNLPMSMVEKALPMLPTEHMHDGQIVIDDWSVSTEELRDLWQEVQNSPDMTFVNVQDGNERVRVWKAGSYLQVAVVGNEKGASGEKVDVRIPTPVIDALLSGDGQQLNFYAAIEALAAHGAGELVTITDNEDRVRVWVDGLAEATD